jgi:hypothetical protein
MIRRFPVINLSSDDIFFERFCSAADGVINGESEKSDEPIRLRKDRALYQAFEFLTDCLLRNRLIAYFFHFSNSPAALDRMRIN